VLEPPAIMTAGITSYVTTFVLIGGIVIAVLILAAPLLVIMEKPAWADWEEWGTCSVSCGNGTNNRIRPCSGGNGMGCPGAGKVEQFCEEPECPIDGGWGLWKTWDPCSVTCGGGTKERDRECSLPMAEHGGLECPGNTTQVRPCAFNGCPQDGAWSAWRNYGPCSVTCGGGIEESTRICNEPLPLHGGVVCLGDAARTQVCATGDCPIDGFWSPWTNWGDCTETCGEGTQTRDRLCDNPVESLGGAPCPEEADQTRTCNVKLCPIDGIISEWTQWGDCGLTCGTGSEFRYRSCTNPVPEHGGETCADTTMEERDCNTFDCPIDGKFSVWTTWTACTVTCGGGTSDRTRACDSPSMDHNGRDCDPLDPVSDQRTCNVQQCLPPP